MATPPRSAADRSLRPPSRRPIGVRAPATMTEPDMRASSVAERSRSVTDDTRGRLHGSSAGRAPRDRRTTMVPMSAPLRPVRAPVHRDRPRRHRRARPRRGDRVLPRHLRHARGPRGDQRGAGRPRGDVSVGGEPSARLVHPAARPADPESTIAKFLDRSGPGLQQLAYRVTDVEQVARGPARARPPAALRRPEARHRRHPDQLRPPQGRRRRAGRAGRARRPTAPTE